MSRPVWNVCSSRGSQPVAMASLSVGGGVLLWKSPVYVCMCVSACLCVWEKRHCEWLQTLWLMPFMFCLKHGRVNRSQFYTVKKGLCKGQLKLAFNNNQGHHQTCLTRRFFFVGLDFMTSLHLGCSFGQKKCFRKKVLLFIAKFSSLVWKKVVNSGHHLSELYGVPHKTSSELHTSVYMLGARDFDITACGF